jgi:hypothetical protein
MTFPSTSHHLVSVASPDRTVSGDPPSDAQRRVVIRLRPFERPVGVLRRRVVAVAAATVLARDTGYARARESLAAAQRRPPTLESKFQAAVTAVSPDRGAVVFTRRSPANARPTTLAVAATHRRRYGYRNERARYAHAGSYRSLMCVTQRCDPPKRTCGRRISPESDQEVDDDSP